ncbi:imidazole glycerol phosphate synthase subunit HisH [Paraferrimonas haliotis]|uniref:Imidazole glycerol phosphate synthase subunit HisH n=1 Tax=Paraferrimonas haliotis TaxID=2013866 RepID=A0AA37WYP8_9GAMM|nr:imidazole glycerol phosphate synthase subunit HisH [Paraferrimonas haliotis]GLS84754.1 imidazole glycerol phosphate synthase subunit HisH [Paraferrimonas haliotis]
MSQLVIVDTGCANLASVKFALQRLQQQPLLSKDPQVIQAAERIILPGVGSAQAAMQSIQQAELVDCLTSLNQPTLGICLGMQLLSAYSDEGEQSCLNVIPTTINAFSDNGLPLPHMGWNQLQKLNHPVFNGIDEGAYVYYVHGFQAPLSQFTVAQSEYGQAFSAAIAKDNFIGLQFHPERSALVGATILQNFLEWQR